MRHSFRKTGYLFGLWGGGDFKTIRTSARHKSDKMAQRYMDDAAFLLQNAKAYDENAEFQVPRFKMSILINEESGRRINENSLLTDMQSLSSEFLRRCGISPCHQGRYDQRFLLKQAMDYSVTTTTSEDLTRALEGLSIDRVRRIKALFVQFQAAAQAQAEYEPSPPVEAIDSNETQPKPKRGGTEPLRDRSLVSRKHGMEKLDLILQIKTKLPENLSELTEGARTWVYHSLNPIIACLENHCNNDKNEFIKRWPLKGGTSRFGKNCCNGEGDCRGLQ